MARKRNGLVPVGEAFSGLDGPLKAIREASPQAQRHFSQADQVDQLVTASEADPDLGFMARLMALCSLPRTNPGNRLQYKRVNRPYTLYMIAGGGNKLPYGNFPRLILAWLCTEAVRTQSRVLVLGRSLAKFMKTLGVYSSGGGPGSNQAPQPDAAAVRLQCSTVLQGKERGAVRELLHCRERRILVESSRVVAQFRSGHGPIPVLIECYRIRTDSGMPRLDIRFSTSHLMMASTR